MDETSSTRPQGAPAKNAVHLVGSIPLDTADEVFELVGPILKACCSRYPDGETGARKNWIGWQLAAFQKQDALRQIEDRERDYQLHAPFTFAPGKSAGDLDFSDLGFAREAIESYSSFVRQQEAGVVSSSARFLVAIPTPFAPVYSFAAYDSQEQILPVYEKAVLQEVDRIADAVPHEHLSIQWDVATEMSIFEQVFPAVFDRSWDVLIGKLAALGDHIPETIELGYHLCYGSMNNRHWKEPDDLGMCVKVSNAIAEQVARRIDFIHMPVPVDRGDNAFYAPLEKLALPSDTEVVLGLVHDSQGIDENLSRVKVARSHLDTFSISTECGLGRRDRTGMPALMHLQAELAQHLG